MAAGTRFDPLRNERADQLGRHIFLKRCQASAHLKQNTRKLVQLAQRRYNPCDPIKVELLDMLELASDLKQRRDQQAICEENRYPGDNHGQKAKRDQQSHCAALDRGDEVARRDHGSHDPPVEVQRREGDEVVSAVLGAGYLKLASLPKIREAELASLQHCLNRSKHRMTCNKRSKLRHLAAPL